MAVVIFTIGSAIQAGDISIGMIFCGRTIAGFSVGMLTMVVPCYMSEVSIPWNPRHIGSASAIEHHTGDSC